MSPVIYYNEEASTILPYIVAPLPDLQDTMLVGPKNFAAQHDAFITLINNDGVSLDSAAYSARAFTHDGYLNVSIKFNTDSSETDSERLGLKLTLGALFKLRQWPSSMPCRYFMQLFLIKFDKILDVQLYSNGAAAFINTLKKVQMYRALKQKLQGITTELIEAATLTNPKRNFFFNNIFPIKKKSNLPKVILCSEHQNGLDMIMLFLSAIEKQTSNRRSRIDLSTDAIQNDNKVQIIQCLPSGLDGIAHAEATMSNYKEFYICLYK